MGTARSAGTSVDSGQFDVPVAFIVFNRPEPTRAVFREIARARPRRLLVIGDGPRPERAGEADRVAEVREIVAAVDWPCEVSTNFSPVNLGCKARVSSGLDWLFGLVEEAVILEDDCVPTPGFFSFCDEMLKRYRTERRVFAISGSNFSRIEEPPGHYFSKYALMWGWATWRDRWHSYRVEPDDYSAVLQRTWRWRPMAFLYWRKIFATLAAGKIDTWDYQWILTVWRNGALAVRPTVNLVENIGFGPDATHTVHEKSRVAGLPRSAALEGFTRRVGALRADHSRDRVDEREWALIGVRTLLLLYFPRLGEFRRR